MYAYELRELLEELEDYALVLTRPDPLVPIFEDSEPAEVHFVKPLPASDDWTLADPDADVDGLVLPAISLR